MKKKVVLFDLVPQSISLRSGAIDQHCLALPHMMNSTASSLVAPSLSISDSLPVLSFVEQHVAADNLLASKIFLF